MAARDIMPYRGPHGGHPAVAHFVGNFATDTEEFEVGEPVYVDTSGDLSESPDPPLASDAGLIGIAAAGPGTSQANINPRTGNAFADGDYVPVYLTDPTTLWATRFFTTNGTAFDNAQPDAAAIGDSIELEFITPNWGIHNTPAANAAVGRLVDAVDADGRSIRDGATFASGDIYFVIFSLTGALAPGDEVGDPIA